MKNNVCTTPFLMLVQIPSSWVVVLNSKFSLPIMVSCLFLHPLYFSVIFFMSLSYPIILLSIYQLANNNNCSLLFDSKGVQIQDNVNKRLLYSEPCRNGNYLFSTSPYLSSCSSPKALTNLKVSFNLWHTRLGYPYKAFVFSFNFQTC